MVLNVPPEREDNTHPAQRYVHCAITPAAKNSPQDCFLNAAFESPKSKKKHRLRKAVCNFLVHPQGLAPLGLNVTSRTARGVPSGSPHCLSLPALSRRGGQDIHRMSCYSARSSPRRVKKNTDCVRQSVIFWCILRDSNPGPTD